MTDRERLQCAKNILDKIMIVNEKLSRSEKLLKIRELIKEELAKPDPVISGLLSKNSKIWERNE
jgi:hypothetical protein